MKKLLSILWCAVGVLLLLISRAGMSQAVSSGAKGTGMNVVSFDVRPVLLNAEKEIPKEEEELGADDIEGFIERGMQYLEEGDYDEALANFDQAIGIYKEAGIAWYYRALANFQLGRFRQARSDFKQALEHDNMLFEARLGLAGVEIMIGNLIEAKRQLNIYVKALPDQPNGYFLLGMASLAEHELLYGPYSFGPFNPYVANVSKQHIKAKKYFKKALKIDPTYSPAYVQLGLLSIDHLHMDEAIKFFKRSIRYDSTFQDGYLMLTSMYINLQKYKKAEETILQLINLNPDAGYNYMLLAFINARQKQPDVAIEYCLKSVALAPPLPDEFAEDNKEIVRTFNFKHLLTYYANQRDGLDAATRQLLDKNMIKMMVGKFGEIEEDMLRLLSKQPDNTTALLMLGMVYEYFIEPRTAIKYYSLAINEDDGLYIAYQNRGLLYSENMLLVPAVRDFTNLLRLEPQATLPYFFRAKSKLRGKDYIGAVLDLDKFLDRYPENTEALMMRGICKESLQRYTEAHEDYQQVTQLITWDTAANVQNIEGALKYGRVAVNVFRAQLGMVRCELAQGDSSRARQVAQKVLQYNKRNDEAYRILAQLAMQNQDWQKARLYYDKGIESNTQRAKLYVGRGKVSLIEGNYFEAMNDFDRALSIDKKLGEAYYLRAIAYWQTGNKEQALVDKNMAKVLKYDDSTWDLPIPLPDWPE